MVRKPTSELFTNWSSKRACSLRGADSMPSRRARSPRVPREHEKLKRYWSVDRLERKSVATLPVCRCLFGMLTFRLSALCQFWLSNKLFKSSVFNGRGECPFLFVDVGSRNGHTQTRHRWDPPVRRVLPSLKTTPNLRDCFHTFTTSCAVSKPRQECSYAPSKQTACTCCSVPPIESLPHGGSVNKPTRGPLLCWRVTNESRPEPRRPSPFEPGPHRGGSATSGSKDELRRNRVTTGSSLS